MSIEKLFQRLFQSFKRLLAKFRSTKYQRQSQNLNRKLPPLTNRVQTDLEALLEDLAARAWAEDERSWYPEFALQPGDLAHASTLDRVVEIFLDRARKIAPKLSVPYFVPRVIVESTPVGVGKFEVDEEGWVTISVSPNFCADKLAAQAILAHEVCHYILENSGIRHRDVALNERYTDLCMFVCGFGRIFRSGYKRAPDQNGYRPGHQLGYLTDEEYEFADRYVERLRESHKLKLSSVLDTLKKQLLQLTSNDRDLANSLIEYERRRSPTRSEVLLCEDAIDRLIRDRR